MPTWAVASKFKVELANSGALRAVLKSLREAEEITEIRN